LITFAKDEIFSTNMDEITTYILLNTNKNNLKIKMAVLETLPILAKLCK